MRRGSFSWRGDTYILDNSTWLFWGDAHLVEDIEGEIRLLTTEDQLNNMALSIEMIEPKVDENILEPINTWVYLKDQGIRLGPPLLTDQAQQHGPGKDYRKNEAGEPDDLAPALTALGQLEGGSGLRAANSI